MISLVLRAAAARRGWWKDRLQSLLPGMKIFLWDEDDYDPHDIDVAVVWAPPLGGLARFSNLKCVVSMGAGVDHVLCDPDYPKHVPLIRTSSNGLRARMGEYVALHVLRAHRRLPDIEKSHATKTWAPILLPRAQDVTVGIMGMGDLGQHAAGILQKIGYRVCGWSKTKKEVDGVVCYAGDDHLKEFLNQSNVLVCLLPLTAQTENILCKAVFDCLPDGAFLINAGRGACVHDQDLMMALSGGKLRGATLDVLREEPLPAENPLWVHPDILITSHSASLTDPDECGKIIADNIQMFLRGDDVPDLVDVTRGY